MTDKKLVQNPSTQTRLSFSLAFYILTAAISTIWFIVLLQMQFHLYHEMFFTSDLAYYCNIFYNTGWGQFLYSDFAYIAYGFNTFLSDHFSPSLVLLVPIYKIVPSPATLIVIQVFAIATAGWLLAQIGRILVCNNARLSRWTLIVPLLAQELYLFNQSTIEATRDIPYGFHHDCLIPLFLLATMFFYLKFKFSKTNNKQGNAGYLVCAGVCFIILLGVKENVPIISVAFLLPVLLFDRRADKKLILWALLCCGIMIAGSFAFQYIASTNKRNLGAVSDFLSLAKWVSKFDSLHYISTWRVLLYFIPLILTPQAYTPFFAELLLQIIVDKPFSWYKFPIVAISGLAAMTGTIALFSRMHQWRRLGKIPVIVMFVVYMFLLYIPAVWEGCNKLVSARKEVFLLKAQISASDIKNMAHLIPLDVKLATTSDLIVFFANRPHLRGPDQLKGIDMIITSDTANYKGDFEMREYVQQWEKDGAIFQIKQMGSLHLYHRNPKGPDIVYDKMELRKKKLETLKQAICAKPDDAKLYYELGLAYNESGSNSGAIQAYKQAVHIKPDYFEACYAMGQSYGLLGRHDDAVEAYKQAINIKPDFAEAYCGLGVSNGMRERFSEAIKALMRAISIKPDYAEAHYNLSSIYIQLERYDEAIKACKQAIRIKPDYFEAHCNMGLAYGKLGCYNEAVETLKQAIRITPHYLPYYNLGVIYYKLRYYDKAIEAYKQSINLSSNNAEAHFDLGIVYLEIGDKTSVLNEYKILKDLDEKKAEQLLTYIHNLDKSKKM